MWTRLTKSILGVAVGTLPVAAVAQAPVITTPLGTETNTGPTPLNEIGGIPTIDMIRVSGDSPGIPLRYGNVTPNSEVVFLDGIQLVRGLDYQFDAALGVVYLKKSGRPGQVMRVSYRYKTGAAASPGNFPGFGALSFDVLPGAFSFKAGLGMAERQGDGSVLTSNIYGWNNNFGFGQSKLTGMFFLGQRSQVNATSGFEYQNKPGVADQGQSQFLLQKLSTALAGGTLEANYQDISKNFTAFQAVRESGADQAIVDQLSKEKGLTRMGFSLNNVDLGGAKLSQSFKEVADKAGNIQWQSYGFKRGGLQLSWNQQKVGKSFTRFQDIAEANRAQLAKEAGLTRESFAGSYGAKFGNLTFDQNSIEDGQGQGIYRRSVKLDTSKLKFNLGEQDISTNFTRFASLSEPEQAQWARERGMNRRWMTMDYSLFGAKAAPLHFAQSSFSGQSGSFKTTAIAATVGKWNIQHDEIGSSKGFTGLGSLAQSEIDANIRSVAEMYGAGNAPLNAQDRNFFVAGAGIDRSYTKISGEPYRGWNVTFDDLRLRGSQGGASADKLSIKGKNFALGFSTQDLGFSFPELPNLMTFEKQSFGQVAGLKRTDFTFAANLGGARSMSFSSTDAGTKDGGLDRTVLNYTDKGLSFSGGMRNVGQGLPAGTQFSDPERDLIGTLLGFNEKDMHLKWDIQSNLKLDTSYFDAYNDLSGRRRFMSNTVLSWLPDKFTTLGYVDVRQKNDDPYQLLLANSVERFSLSRNLGRYGLVTYLKEDIEYNGALANMPGSHKEYFAYETKVNPTTSVKTEQTTTSFDNGDKENIDANTVSTELTKKVGVSVSEINIDRTGDSNDEQKRNYGLWWDIGNGLRFSYGYARQLTGANGTQLETMGLGASPGTDSAHLGNLSIGAANYSLLETNSVATQGANNVALSTLKPMSFGILKDVKLSFSYDALNAKSTWVKENHFFGFNGRIGSNGLSVEYKSQALPTGAKGIDRSFGFTTDQNAKRPLQASVQYKVRSLPTGEELAIQNISFTARPAKGVELTNQLLTNPEVAKGDALLGSVVQASRADKWKLDFKGDSNAVFGGSWTELVNDQAHTSSRTAGLNLTLWKKSGSPVSLFYGLEDTSLNGKAQKAFRYQLQFDQRPGPNQTFSFFLGNVSYEGMPAAGFSKDNWSLRLDYQLRF